MINKRWTICGAARKLSIKISTAKLIVKKYKEEGAFFEKRDDKIVRLNAERVQIEANQNFTGLAFVPSNEFIVGTQA